MFWIDYSTFLGKTSEKCVKMPRNGSEIAKSGENVVKWRELGRVAAKMNGVAGELKIRRWLKIRLKPKGAADGYGRCEWGGESD